MVGTGMDFLPLRAAGAVIVVLGAVIQLLTGRYRHRRNQAKLHTTEFFFCLTTGFVCCFPARVVVQLCLRKCFGWGKLRCVNRGAATAACFS